MSFKRKIAGLLTAVMAFSSVATFNVSADARQFVLPNASNATVATPPAPDSSLYDLYQSIITNPGNALAPRPAVNQPAGSALGTAHALLGLPAAVTVDSVTIPATGRGVFTEEEADQIADLLQGGFAIPQRFRGATPRTIVLQVVVTFNPTQTIFQEVIIPAASTLPFSTHTHVNAIRSSETTPHSSGARLIDRHLPLQTGPGHTHQHGGVDLLIPISSVAFNGTQNSVIHLELSGSQFNFDWIAEIEQGNANHRPWMNFPFQRAANGAIGGTHAINITEPTDVGWYDATWGNASEAANPGANPIRNIVGIGQAADDTATDGRTHRVPNNLQIIGYTGFLVPGEVMEVPFRLHFQRATNNAPGHARNAVAADIVISPAVLEYARNFDDVSGQQAYVRVPLIVQLTGEGPATVAMTGNVSTPVGQNTVNFSAGAATGTAFGRIGDLATGRETASFSATIRENTAGAFRSRENAGSDNRERGFRLELPNGYRFDILNGTNFQITAPHNNVVPGTAGYGANVQNAANTGNRNFRPLAASGAGVPSNQFQTVTSAAMPGANWRNVSAGAVGTGGTFTHDRMIIQFDGVPTAAQRAVIESTAAANANTSFFYLTHGGRVLNMVFGNNVELPAGQNIARTLSVNGMAITHDNLANPRWESNIRVNLVNVQGGGVTNAHIDGVSLLDFGLTFNRVSGNAGQIQDIVSGRTFDEHTPTGSGTTAGRIAPTDRNDFEGVVARVRLEEQVSRSLFARPVVFTLTDADGNVLEGAKIAGAEFNSNVGAASDNANARGFWGNTVFFNAVGEHQNAAQIIDWTTDGGRSLGDVEARLPWMVWAADGHSVTIEGLRRHNVDNTTWIEATFFVSTDINFEGDVYITVSGTGVGGVGDAAINNRSLHVATVERLFDVTSVTTDLQIGFQRIAVADVVIAEREYGFFQTGDIITLGLTEFALIGGRSEIGFNPINNNNITVTGHTSEFNRINATVVNQAAASTNIQISVNRPSSVEPSTITLSGLTVYVNHSVPFGHYDLVVSGRAILDNMNGSALINPNTIPGTTTPNTPTSTDWRRFGFNGLVIENYVNVVTPGAGMGAGAAAIVSARAGSAEITVNGVVHTITTADGTNRPTPAQLTNDRLFFPVRFVQSAMGVDMNNVLFSQGVVTIIHDGRTVQFTEHSNVMIVNGAPIQMDVAAYIYNGTMFVPFRFLGYAFGSTVGFDQATYTAWFNNPAFPN